MANTAAPSDIHLVYVAFPAYGHVRPLKSLATSLAAAGYTATFITGDAFKPSLASIKNLDFVPFPGKANFHLDNVMEAFPERAKQPQDATRAVWDIEHIFFGCLDDTFKGIQSVLSRPDLAGKKVVLLTDALTTGSLPISLESPQARRVPVIALASFPFFSLSKDTAPFGLGLPSQGEEKNRELNAMATQMFTNAHVASEKLLAKYNCAKPLPTKFPLDNMFYTPDAYLQLTVPQMEFPRSDLPPHVKFVGSLLGANDNKGYPDWWQSFVIDNTAQPLVVVTSGTLPGMDSDQLIKPTIEACRDLPVRLVVCAVNAHLPEDYTFPPNVRVANWLPFDELFKHTSVVVSNGGYGGICQAFAAGLPMIVAGLTEDKAETTARAAMTGAALNLKTQTPNTAQVKQALETILKEDTFKEKALELKDAYAGYDTVGEIEKTIADLVGTFYG